MASADIAVWLQANYVGAKRPTYKKLTAEWNAKNPTQTVCDTTVRSVWISTFGARKSVVERQADHKSSLEYKYATVEANITRLQTELQASYAYRTRLSHALGYSKPASTVAHLISHIPDIPLSL